LFQAALLRRPAEILLSSNADEAWRGRIIALNVPVTSGDPNWFSPRTARDTLTAQFRDATLAGLGVAGMTAAIQAAGGALGYLRAPGDTPLCLPPRLQRLGVGDAVALHPPAVTTLELLETAYERSSRGSLLATLDRTRTPMGARLLRQWLLRPLL